MANLNLSQFSEKLFVADADHTFIWDTVGAISKRVSRNSWLNSGTLTSDAPVTISQTWNAGSNVMTALRLNVTDTASGSTSKLLELYAGATPVSVLEIDKIGRLRIGSTAANAHGTRTNPAFRFANNNSGFYTNAASGYINFAGSGTSPLCFSPAGIILSAGAYFQWTSGVNDPLDSSTVELALLRDAANTLALRNGAAAQTFNVYGTYSTSPSLAYSRLAIACDTSGNATLTTQSTGVAGTVSINGVPVGRGTGTQSFNIAIGSSALLSKTTGDLNVALGVNSSAFLTTGSQNTTLGANSLISNTTGSNNAVVGFQAARYITGGATALTVSENSVFLGANTKAFASGETNQIVIGYDATGIGSNSVVLGNDSITKTALKGNVGIGTTAPGATLQVVGNAIFGENVTSGSTTPLNVSFGGSYGTNTPGDKGNLKWDLYRDASGGRTGIGISGGLMEFQGAAGVAFGFYPNNSTTSALRIIANGNVGIGTTSPTSKLHVALNPATNYTTEKVQFGNVFFGNGVSDYSFMWMGGISTPLTLSNSNYVLGSDGSGTILNSPAGSGITFQVGGANRWSLPNTGHLLAAVDGQYDIGASGANRPRNVYVGTNVISRPAASITPANNGEFVVEATSNTTLTFKLKGTDGTVRSGTITLA